MCPDLRAVFRLGRLAPLARDSSRETAAAGSACRMPCDRACCGLVHRGMAQRGKLSGIPACARDRQKPSCAPEWGTIPKDGMESACLGMGSCARISSTMRQYQ